MSRGNDFRGKEGIHKNRCTAEGNRFNHACSVRIHVRATNDGEIEKRVKRSPVNNNLYLGVDIGILSSEHNILADKGDD
jgi:hypothetical protein